MSYKESELEKELKEVIEAIAIKQNIPEGEVKNLPNNILIEYVTPLSINIVEHNWIYDLYNLDGLLDGYEFEEISAEKISLKLIEKLKQL